MTKSRDHILIYLNGERREIRGTQAFMTLSDYLRYERQLTGTKVVCAEGDCGACSVLVGQVKPNANQAAVTYRTINACIQFMHGLDCTQIITIEGLPENQDDSEQLHPVQTALINAQATQCGFCTPGFAMAATGMLEKKGANSTISPQQARNYLTGNLCRCTGYQSIINAITSVETDNTYQSIKQRYHTAAVHKDLQQHAQIGIKMKHEKNSFVSPTNIIEAAQFKAKDKHQVFAAATDLGVQYNKGHWQQQQVINLNLIEELHEVTFNQDSVRIGARVTLTELEQALQERHPEWVEFMHIFASPQIKNNGTLIGNIANGSPIGDNLPFLLAMDAVLTLHSPSKNRRLNINQFYLGYKKMDLAADELISHVEIPNKPDHCLLRLYKVSQRRDLDISCVSAAFMMSFDQNDTLQLTAIALGGVAATPIRLPVVEQKLLGKKRQDLIDASVCEQTAAEIAAQVTPMSDVRGSQVYRELLVANLYHKFMDELQQWKANY
ncbi:MAG: xanthine dehydrogenase small subunit [Marinicella sp.]